MERNRQQGSAQDHYGRDRMQAQSGNSRQQGGSTQGSRQQSQQGGEQQALGARQFHSIAEVAVRGTALLWDLQMETARNLWRTQARTAAMLGIPDCSDLFQVGDERARRLFSTSADQVLNSARQARDTVVAMQRQFGRLAEQQRIGITEEVRDQIEQIGRHTEQGLQAIEQIAASEADQIEDLVQQTLERGDEARSEQSAADASQAQGEPAAKNGAQQRASEEAGTAEANANESRPQRETRRHEERSRARR